LDTNVLVSGILFGGMPGRHLAVTQMATVVDVPALPVRKCRNRMRIFAYILLGLATISSTARSQVKILSDP